MCGVAGLIWTPGALGQRDPDVLARTMAQDLFHRGPDGLGVWADRESGVGLVHRRLAIIDLSDAGAQPMKSVCDRYVLTYNGEIYNFPALRAQVGERAPGWHWRGRSDTEVLLALFTIDGVETSLRRLDGMFVFAVWDRELRKIILARDRFGEKPLSYGLKGGVLAFGSEVTPVRNVLGLTKEEINPSALSALLSYQTIPAPLSIFKGVRKLPPGCLVTISHGDIAKGSLPDAVQYWSPREIAENAASSRFKGSFEDATDECELRLKASVKSRMIADVPVGTMLSSGVDSVCITALAQSIGSTRVKTYTIGVEGDGFNEASIAAEIAKRLETDHTTIPVGEKECVNAATQVARIYDEPFADSSQIVTAVLARAVRKDVTVALSGDGGDELFAGYTRHIFGPNLWRKISKVPASLRTVASAGCSLVGEARIAEACTKFIVLKNGQSVMGETSGRIQKAIRAMNAGSESELYEQLISQHGTDALLNQPGHGLGPRYRALDCKHLNQSELFLRSMLVSDVEHYLPETIMTKVDRASMAVSLEARAPFLNADLLEFAWSLPVSYLTRGGAGKAITRALASRHVGVEALTRPKQGFSVPLDRWLRGPLKDWASDLLLSSGVKEDALLNAASIRKLWDRHQSGAQDVSGQLWPIIAYRAWWELQE
jgi:asparagine synthase (glutamine-hydrolysing)